MDPVETALKLLEDEERYNREMKNRRGAAGIARAVSVIRQAVADFNREILDYPRAEEYSGYTRRGLEEMVRRGELPLVKIGSRVGFRRGDLPLRSNHGMRAAHRFESPSPSGPSDTSALAPIAKSVRRSTAQRSAAPARVGKPYKAEAA